MTHTATITKTKTTESRVVAKKGYPYGVRKDISWTTYGYKCDCGASYNAHDGASTITTAKAIAAEQHENARIIWSKA